MKKRSEKTTRRIDVGVLVPCMGSWDMYFGKHLVALFAKTMGWRPGPEQGVEALRVRLYTLATSMLVKSRHKLIKNALKDGCTHILFIDSDMTFPDDGLLRLLQRRKPVVGANYTTRQWPVNNVAVGLDGERLDSRGKYGCQRVQHLGCGFMLVEAEAIKKLEPPLFLMDWIPSLGDYCGEDVYFCAKLQAAGYGVYVDHELSQQMGHIGKIRFGPNMLGVEQPQPFKNSKEDSD